MMYRHALQRFPSPAVQLLVFHTRIRHTFIRTISNKTDIESKYVHKLSQVAEKLGISVEELKAKRKEEHVEKSRLQHQRKRQAPDWKETERAPSKTSSAANAQGTHELPSWTPTTRKDSSPIKPLSSILNFKKLLEKPHTSEQVTALWSAYHQIKSTSSGNGHIWATIPVHLYQKMADMAERYPTFVVPVPRPPTGTESETPHEFFFLQWDFHDAPPIPTAHEDIFSAHRHTEASDSSNPKTSTILFTPLQEYKMRAAFATPYLVITHYTDLVHSHGIVLLRGDITPSSASSGTDGVRYLLSDGDSQLLSMAVQKFYLWDGEGRRLLAAFHETPNDFKWEEVLKHAESNV